MRVELKHLGEMSSTTSLYVTHDYQEALALGDRIAILRAGRVVQIDPPNHVWDEPVDTFVAKALGEPEINLLPAETEGGTLRAAGGAITLVPPAALPSSDGRVRLGLRPRDLHLVAGDGAGQASSDAVLRFDGVVRLSERLGRQMELTVEVGDDFVVVVTEDPVSEKSRVTLEVPLEQVHLFESAPRAEDSARIGSAAGPGDRAPASSVREGS